MRNLFRVTLITLFVFAGAFAAHAYDINADLKKEKLEASGITPKAVRPSISIQLFEDRSGANAPGEAITEMLTTELVSADKFMIMEREKIVMSTKEQEMAASGLMDMDTAPERGKLKGADFSITGAITEFRTDSGAGVIPIPGLGGIAIGSHTATVMLDLRVVNNRTGEVIAAIREKGSSNASVGGLATRYGGFGGGKTGGVLAGATHKVVVRIVNQIISNTLPKMQNVTLENKQAELAPAKSYHVLAIDPKFTTAQLDIGAASGARKGQYYSVYRVTGTIRGLKGEVLGEEKTHVAILQILEVQQAFSTAKVLKLGQNRKIQRGDKVQRINAPTDVVVK